MSQSDFVTRGQALVNSGQHQEAVKVCRLGLLGRPTTVEGRIVLGQALLALKRYDEVLAEMRVALELDHTSVNAQVLKAEALLSKGDAHAAIEVLDKLRPQAPGDPRIDSLIGIAQRSVGKPSLTASHPSVGFVGDNTRHYPNHANHDDDGDETTGGSFNQATAVSSPAGSKKRSGAKPVQLDPMPVPSPPEHILAVGDKSGTVEVDPEADGIELDGEEEDFGDVAAPPPGRSRQMPAVENQRGQLFSVSGVPVPRRAQGLPTPGLERARGGKKNRGDVSSVELVDDDLVELDAGETFPAERRLGQPGPGTRVRNAVNVPSGPLDGGRPGASRPTAHEQPIAPPPHLAQMIANAPHILEVARAQPSTTMRGNPGGPIAAALPTMTGPPLPAPLAATLPPLQATAIGMPVMHNPNAMAIPDPNMQSASPAWARQTVAANQQIHQGLLPGQAHHEELTSRPAPLDASIASLLSEGSSPSASAIAEPSHSGVRALKTGMRKGRSRLQIVIWLLIGGLVIAGGVFVGFKFRAMRLEKKIADTRDVALGLAKADTWKGLVRARDRLAGIAQASPTPDNKAALARTRAQIAFEFGEGLPEAKTAVEGLAGEGGIDVEIAATYLALAQNDVKTALNAADRASKLGDDPAAHYVMGQAHLLAGDATTAIEHLKKAADKEARPLYLLGLARAHADNTQWAQALAVIDPAKIKVWYDAFDPDTARELGASGIDLTQLSADHPGLAIERAGVLVASGKVAKGPELRGALEKVVAEGGKSLNDQVRGVSPTQVAFAHLALSTLDFYLGNKKSQADFNAALAVGLDDQRFAEQAIETAYLTTDFVRAQKAAEVSLKAFPNSRRTRIALAKVLLAQGKPTEAQNVIAKLAEVDKFAKSLAVRGQIRLALDDLEKAKDDFDRALAQSGKNLEEALVGRTWVDIRLGDIQGARQRLRERFQAAPSIAVTTAWAAILTASNSSEDRKTAKAELERVVNGPLSLDTWRAQLQLARLDREIGDEGAKVAYSKAYELTGNVEIRIETATYLIDYTKPLEGLDMLEQLLKTMTTPSPELLLEAARANLLVGKHARGAELLDQVDKLPNGGPTRWKYERERGRLAFRKASFNEAATAFESALDKCGDDVETFYLAAEIAMADEKKPNTKLIDKIRKLAPERLKDRPERKIVDAKLLGSKGDEATKLYSDAKVAIGEASPPRRRSQAALGLGIVAYNKEDDPAALVALDLAFTLDPTIYEGYLYYADIKKSKDAGKDRDAELKSALDKAKLAIEFNPDNLDAYVMVGQVAYKMGNRKLVNEMTTKVNALAPNSEQLKALQTLR